MDRANTHGAHWTISDAERELSRLESRMSSDLSPEELLKKSEVLDAISQTKFELTDLFQQTCRNCPTMQRRLNASVEKLTAASKKYVDQEMDALVTPLLEQITERDKTIESQNATISNLLSALSQILSVLKSDVPETYSRLPESVRALSERTNAGCRTG